MATEVVTRQSSDDAPVITRRPSKEDCIRTTSRISVSSALSETGHNRRVSRDFSAEDGGLSLHISGRYGVDVILGKPGQTFTAEHEKASAMFRAAHGLTKALSYNGVATVITNFRGMHQSGPDPQVSLFGTMPGLDLQGDYHKHWTDFAETWVSNGVPTRDIYECLRMVNDTLQERMSNAKGFAEAYDSLKVLNTSMFQPKGISINFHVLVYTCSSGWTGLFTSTTKVDPDVFFISITPWNGTEPVFPNDMADLEVKVAVGTSKPAVWRLGSVWTGEVNAKEMSRTSSKDKKAAAPSEGTATI